MCYDISFTVNIREIGDYIPDLIYDSQISINFDVTTHIMAHAYGEHPIIYVNRDDMKVHCRLMEWGCIPFYVKDEKSFTAQRSTMLNARSERVLADDKSYWYKIRNRRCLIPVTGIYEHQEVKGQKKKIPYFIKLREQPLFFIPGLYSVAELPDKETGELVKRFTFTLITRSANSVMEKIHNGGDNKFRMPLFLPHDLSLEWLSEGLSPERYKEILDYKMDSEALSYHTVYTIRGRSERPDGKPKNFEWNWEEIK
ncbi:MAG: SOS response-associated peptidase family protein [Flavitalea sp.]